MAHPMLHWLLDTRYADQRQGGALRAVRVRGTNESALIPVFERVEAAFPGVRSFSLPSVDHATLGPHIEIGVKGADPHQVDLAMAALREGAAGTGATEIAAS
jgi:molybdopterin-biosynthesis enzyme MoeA-like protein